MGLAYLPAIIAVSFYFEKRRSLATGLAVCGSGIGTFMFAPLTDILLHEFGWKGTVLIETGILLNCIVCGLIFRPLPVMKNKKTLTRGQNSLEMDKTPTSTVTPSGSGLNDTHKMTMSCTSLLHRQSSWRHGSQTANDGRKTSSENWLHLIGRDEMLDVSVLGPMARKDIFYPASLENIPKFTKDPDGYKRSIMSIPNVGEIEEAEKGGCIEKIGCSKEIRHTLLEMMDFTLLLDIVFILFAISNLLTSIGFVVPYIFLPDCGMDRGLLTTESAYLVSTVGIANTVGRIVFGYLADFAWVNRLVLYNTVLVLCGLVSIGSFLCDTFLLLVSYAALFGLFIGEFLGKMQRILAYCYCQ